MKYLIKNIETINEKQRETANILIENEKISDIFQTEVSPDFQSNCIVIDGTNKILLPGVIDTHVHFREPGLTHKADIYSESKAAVAGGVTTFFDMPNTIPQTTNIKELEAKFDIAAQKSLANYSFYIGATNENIDQLLNVDIKNVCGVKLFLGASTGNMLVNNETALISIFSKLKTLIAAHCEDETTININIIQYKEKYGEDIDFKHHAQIRSDEACYKSSAKAVSLAHKFNTRLHLLHLSTYQELELLENTINCSEKRITSEVGLNHLLFSANDYSRFGSLIKLNPSIKAEIHQMALLKALKNNRIDVISTDHSPHTIEEKMQTYFKAPSGIPSVQFLLPSLLQFHKQNKLSLEEIVEKVCHNPAKIFQIEKRGFIKKGYFADLVIISLQNSYEVKKENIYHKCKWSPLEGETFDSLITHTFVNGNLVFENNNFHEQNKGLAVKFNR